MAVQDHIDNLKDRPKDERVAVAGGIASGIVLVILVAWAILFFKNIQRGTQEVNLTGGAQDEFNFSNVKQAQEALKETYGASQEDLLQIRNDAASQQLQSQQQVEIHQIQDGSTDEFGLPPSD